MNIRQLLRRSRFDRGPRLADDGSLVVVGSSFDPSRPDSAVVGEMADAGVDVSRPLLLRHHVHLPDDLAVEEARRIVAEDGYALVAEDGEESGVGEPGIRVRISRPQQITGIAIAEERSRVTGLVRRLGGDVDGWDVLAAR
jgi:hypothetical protein